MNVHLGSRTFPALPDQAGIVRRWLGGLLGEDHPAGDDSVLLLSETFTNSIVHGSGDTVGVSVFTGVGVVHVEVVDGGGGTVPHYVDDPCGEGGRGLPILRALARDWGFEVVDGGGLKVWFNVTHDLGSVTGDQRFSDGHQEPVGSQGEL